MTASPLGTTNQIRPEVPKVNACAEDIITAIDQVHTAMTEPTPKPKPMRRSAMTKSWVFLTIERTVKATTNMKAPRPSISAKPRPGDRLDGWNTKHSSAR